MIQDQTYLWQTRLTSRVVSLRMYQGRIQTLQEEVMEFEIKDIEILDTETSGNVMLEAEKSLTSESKINSQINRQTPTESNRTQNSLIMNDLHKETEELQNKLKLNYRRLLLFEAENNKLNDEKNKLFFEVQNYLQKNQILTEKNESLEKQNVLTDNTQKLLTEKLNSYEKINKTQFVEIKRFSKFHTKIQEVVKPFIVQLKKQIIDLRNELSQSQRINTNLTGTYKEFCKKIELDLNQKTLEIASLHAEKNRLIQTYEEQIHSFSKEIVELQSKNESAHKEISRLKKSVEFKNYFENEVIRFKRTHEEDQTIVNDLSQKKSAAEAKILMLEQDLSTMKIDCFSAKNKVSDLEANLEVIRTQFSKKMNELTILNERFARLEKLNNQLSLEISSQ